jgi:nucleotide-binding universal stress UspA family protein
MQRILVATDDSEGAGRALDAAAGLAAQLHCELWIVTVMGSMPEEVLERMARADASAAGDVIDAISHRILSDAKARALKRGASTIHLEACSGDAAEGILDTARKIRADAIFVGRRGRGRLSGLLLGSVSHKLVSLAPCMVIVVP